MTAIDRNVIGVSLFNETIFTINDVSEEELKKSKLIMFCADYDYVNEKHKIEDAIKKCKSYVRFNIDDGIDPSDYEQVVKELGYVEMPNKKNAKEIIQACQNEDNLIVACVLGICRSGALIEYLQSKSYKLNKNYNTDFTPEENMLSFLKNVEKTM